MTLTASIEQVRSKRADRTRAVTDIDGLTPVEWLDGLAFKRDDLYLPFPDIDLNGGKVRQAMKLVESHLDEIKAHYGSTLITATGVHSPQGLIIARVAVAFDLRCRLFAGVTTDFRRHRMLATAQSIGAEIDTSSRIAYETGLAKTIKQWRADHDGRGYPIRFGMNLDTDPAAILGTTAEQCRNIPEQVTTVVIPVGAGVTAAGIIRGCAAHARHVERIVCIQIAGVDRRKALTRIAGTAGYEWHQSYEHGYSHQVGRRVSSRLVLDPIYEAKAYDFMRRHLDVPVDKTLFWIVGDSRFVR